MPEDPTLKKQLNDLIRGYWTTQAIYIAAELNVAGLLQDGPQTAAELARRAEVDADALYRILRALASIGIFAEDEAGRFGLTPLAEVLGTPGGQGYALLHGRELYQAWGNMLASVKTAQPAFIQTHGMPLFDYMTKFPQRGQIFDRAMTGHHGAETDPMLDAYDFSGFSTLADVGGGNGSLLVRTLERHPRLQGILFDLPAVVDRARVAIDDAGLGDRCRRVGGNFLDQVPPGADAYLLRHVVHDFSDADTVAILKNCRIAAGGGGRVLVVEIVVPGGNEPNFGKWLDLMMLAYGGKERTEDQYRTLFGEAGLTLTRIVPTRAGVSVIEGVPAPHAAT